MPLQSPAPDQNPPDQNLPDQDLQHQDRPDQDLAGPTARVVLYSKPGCHLCDDARVVVAEVCAELGEHFAEVNIAASAELLDRYGEEIPVTFVDGRRHAIWKVDATLLREALA